MSNQWYRSIPQQGMLVKNPNGAVVHAIKRMGCYVDTGNAELERPEDLTPLTADEWWDFSPWQPMETAPLLEDILVLRKADFENKDVVTMTMLHCDSDRNGYKKWLPLPKVD